MNEELKFQPNVNDISKWNYHTGSDFAHTRISYQINLMENHCQPCFIFYPFHLPYDNMTPNIGVVMMLFKDNNIVKWTILCFHFDLSFDEFYILSNILMYDSYFCRYSIMYNQIIQNTILWCINSLQKSFKASFPNWALVVYHHKTSW